MSDEPFIVFIDAVKASVTTPEGVLRSESERAAIVVSIEALRDLSDVELRLDASVREQETLAILLTDADTSELAEELWELGAAGDLVAVPSSLAEGGSNGFSPRGQIIQHVDSELPDTFEVWERRATKADLLTRGAPVDLGEEPDNLGGRADWFRKRHGGDK